MDVNQIREKYNPDNFQYEIKEGLEKIYAVMEGKLDDSISYWAEFLYFAIKDAIKFEEIDPVVGREMQIFFMSLDTDSDLGK